MRPAFDHLVLCVRDLEAARGFYERLGFRLTPRARHPFGTANQLVQLQGNFLELLAVDDPARVPPATPGHFSFGAANAAFLERREGMSMLVFPSEDALADQRRFVARGLDTYAPFDFTRQAKLPDGRIATVSFSLAFVTTASLPDATFFVCQQHNPEYFWKPEYQDHPNGAEAVVEVVIAAPEPARLASFFENLLEPGRVARAGDGLRIALKGGSITVAPAERLRDRHGEVGDGPFVGYRVAVADPGAVERLLAANGVPFRRAGDALAIAPRDAFGVFIEFVAPVR